MTYEERAVGQAIGRLLSEHPDVSPSADGALDNLDQVHLGGPARQIARRTFEPEPLFQAAVTMHVQMNVRDKAAWFAHAACCLAPGARLATWEICQPRQADLPWPMPWSRRGSFTRNPG